MIIIMTSNFYLYALRRSIFCTLSVVYTAFNKIKPWIRSVNEADELIKLKNSAP
jgi:hypothetical protein